MAKGFLPACFISAMEIEYIRIKRFNQEIEKVYATGPDLLLFPQ